MARATSSSGVLDWVLSTRPACSAAARALATLAVGVRQRW
jgi:hypothetical protein